MKFQPTADRVVVKRDRAAAETASGIVIPDAAQERPQVGSVVACGPDVKGRLFRTGARVLFGKYSGAEIEIDGEQIIVLREDDIMGIVTGEPSHAGAIRETVDKALTSEA